MTIKQVLLALYFIGISTLNVVQAQADLNQKIHLYVEDQTLKKVLQQIEKQADVRFVFSSKLIQSNQKITADFQDVALAKVLYNLLQPRQLNYEVSGKIIILKRNEFLLGKTPPSVSKPILEEINDLMPIFIIKGHVEDTKKRPLIGASVLLEGTTIGTITNDNGDYELELNQTDKKGVLVFSFVGFEKQIEKIEGRSQINTQLNEGNTLQQVIISVGSRNAQRTITDSPLPIDVLTANDLKNTGQMTFDKVLQYRVPSFNTVNTPVNDATALLDPYEIRNMGASRTLILINGKRKNASALVYIQPSPSRGETGVDISAIPIDAIKRVEILRDGASAQYGSDAIAGVMNIILKDRQDDGVLTFNAGITHKGDGQTVGLSLNNGANIGQKGFINYTIALSNLGLTNRPGTVDAAGEAKLFHAPIADVEAFLKAHPDAGNINGQPATAAAKFLVNVGIPLSKTIDFYANAAYVYKKVNSFANYRTPYWRKTDDGLLHAPGTRYEGYVPTFEGDLNDYNAIIGFKGATESGWNSDVSFTVGGNRQIYTVANSRNIGLGKKSPILFKPGGYDFSHKVSNIDITKNFTDNIHLGIGTELRAERYEIIAGDTASYKTPPGADSFPGIADNNAGESTRFNFGGYVDMGFDITPSFLIDAAIRTEKYSDVGDGKSNYGNQNSFYDASKNNLATVWKVSSRYKIKEFAVIRASLSTGFRAPSLHQVNQQNTQASFFGGQGILIKGITNNRSAQAGALGVPNLKAEKSTNISLGLGFNPNKNTNISIDYYNITLKDRIILGSEISGTTSGTTALDSVLKSNGIVTVSFFTNAINTRTSGLDFVSNFRNIMVGTSKMTVNVSANYQIENKLIANNKGKLITNTDLIEKAGKSVFDATQEALLLTSRPQYKGIFGVDWVLNKWALSINNTLFGPSTFHQSGIDKNLNTRFEPRIVTDIVVNIGFTKKINLAINILNVLNITPKWTFIARNREGGNLLENAEKMKDIRNAITFNGRYSTVTYDGSHFSQLGTLLSTQLSVKF